MKNVFLTATKSVMALAVLHVGVANSANLRQNKLLVEDAIKHAQQHSRRGDSELRHAEHNLSIVRNDIFDLRRSQEKLELERTLDDALRALRDHHMPSYRIADIVEDRGEQALRLINRLMHDDDHGQINPDMENAIESLERALNAAQYGRNGMAKLQLSNAQNDLRMYRGDRDIMAALRNIQQADFALSDRFLNPRRQLDIVQSNIREAIACIKASRDYFQRRPDHGNDRDLLGETGEFASLFTSTQSIFVGARQGNFRAIVLIAKGADMRIDRVDITLGNGRSFTVGGSFVRENGRLVINLPGQDRFIRSISISGQSYGDYRRNRATVVVKGIE